MSIDAEAGNLAAADERDLHIVCLLVAKRLADDSCTYAAPAIGDFVATSNGPGATGPGRLIVNVGLADIVSLRIVDTWRPGEHRTGDHLLDAADRIAEARMRLPGDFPEYDALRSSVVAAVEEWMLRAVHTRRQPRLIAVTPADCDASGLEGVTFDVRVEFAGPRNQETVVINAAFAEEAIAKLDDALKHLTSAEDR